MRTKLCATILIFNLIASGAFAANWKKENSFVNDVTPVKPADTISTQPYVKLDKSQVVFLRPTNTSVNQRLFMPAGGHCHWNHGTSSAQIGVNDAWSGVEIWLLVPNKACSSAGATVGECSVWEVGPGYLLDFTQKTGGAFDGTLVCVGN